MFDPDFLSDEQYIQYATEFMNYSNGKGRGYLNKKSMRDALKACNLIPPPTDKDLDAMCSSDRVDIEQFFFIIFCFLRGFGTRSELLRTFERIDQDHDGKIPFQEIEAILSIQPNKLSEEQISNLKNELNCKEDGLVDYQEFVKKIRNK